MFSGIYNFNGLGNSVRRLSIRQIMKNGVEIVFSKSHPNSIAAKFQFTETLIDILAIYIIIEWLNK